MPTNDLDARFWRACDILRRDDNTQSLLDYVEQISWLLFLKSFEDLEDTRVDDAEYEGRPFERVIAGFYRWSVWTRGRVNRAEAGQRAAEAALRSAQKALLALETQLLPDPDALAAARSAFRDAEAAVKAASADVEAEQQAQRAALAPLCEPLDDEKQTAANRQMAGAILAGLTQKSLLAFLNDCLFPHLRALTGTPEREVIRQIFEEAPSKMVKSGVILRDAIDVVDTIDFHASENVHTLSHLYESLLVRMGREGGMSGEFYTPRAVIKFMVEMVAPRLGETVYDPACGSAGFLVEAYTYMEEHHVRLAADRRRLQDATFFGQEKKPLPYLLGVMNSVLHGITVPRILRTNTLSADVRKFTERDRYHVILTNPPFGGTENVDAIKTNFPYPSSATSILFLQHIMKRLRRDGRAGMVIDEGVLFKTAEGAYTETKRELLEEYNLHAVVSLPAGVFANVTASGTGPKTDLLFFDHLGPTQNVWYYDVRAVGFSLTKTQRPVAENDLPDCLAMWRAYDAWRRTPEDERPAEPPLNDRCWLVSRKELAERNFDLSARNPNRPDDFSHRPPEEIAADIADKQARIAELIAEIQEVMAGENGAQ
jgi:type I restriction enzyme M protein